MLSFGNTLCAAQRSARPKSSFPFYKKLYTYVSPRVSGFIPSSRVASFFQKWQVVIKFLCLLNKYNFKLILQSTVLTTLFQEYSVGLPFQGGQEKEEKSISQSDRIFPSKKYFCLSFFLNFINNGVKSFAKAFLFFANSFS